MKLSELVAYRNEIAQHNVVKDASRMFKTVQDLTNDIKSTVVNEVHDKIRFGEGTYLEQILEDNFLLEDLVNDVQQNLEFYLTQLDLAVLEQGEQYLRDSRDNFDGGWKLDDVNVILNRKLEYTKELASKLRSRLSVYADWRYPGLCVGPMRSEFTSELVSNDPLYVCDIDEQLLTPFLNQQNEVYKHRLRPYVIQHWDWNRKLFKDLPTEQFGLVFIANYFEFKPLEGIKSILTEVHDLLRPGGTCVFTFNDCDNYQNIKLCEVGFKSYTPGSMLAEVAKELGYKITYQHDHSYGFSWMEITKRGTLKTRKGGQSLGRVMHVDDAGVTDKKSYSRYSREEQDTIINEAIALGVDKEDVIRKGAISIGKLELLVKRRKEQLRLERLAETLSEYIHWSASNQGYSKGQHVRHGGKRYVALKDIEAKQRFDYSEWSLVE